MTSAERKPFRELANASSQERELFGIDMPQEQVTISSAESTGRKRKRQGGKMKDPNAPKRATTAFFFFAQDQRPNVRAAHPEFKVTEISKELGKMWRDMSAEQKLEYENRSKADKGRYERELEAYNKKKGAGKQQQQAEESEEEED